MLSRLFTSWYNYRRYRRLNVLAASGYYTFLFIDAIVTLRMNPQNDKDYPLMMLVLFSISVLLLVVHGTLSLTGGHTPGCRD